MSIRFAVRSSPFGYPAETGGAPRIMALVTPPNRRWRRHVRPPGMQERSPLRSPARASPVRGTGFASGLSRLRWQRCLR